MYIKNQSFNDEDTLLEILFDFSLGDPSPVVAELKEQIEKDLSSNEAYVEYHASLTNEEDRMELEAEERLIRLGEALMAMFESFKTKQQKLYGMKAGSDTLLYEIDLV